MLELDGGAPYRVERAALRARDEAVIKRRGGRRGAIRLTIHQAGVVAGDGVGNKLARDTVASTRPELHDDVGSVGRVVDRGWRAGKPRLESMRVLADVVQLAGQVRS